MVGRLQGLHGLAVRVVGEDVVALGVDEIAQLGVRQGTTRLQRGHATDEVAVRALGAEISSGGVDDQWAYGRGRVVAVRGRSRGLAVEHEHAPLAGLDRQGCHAAALVALLGQHLNKLARPGARGVDEDPGLQLSALGVTDGLVDHRLDALSGEGSRGGGFHHRVDHMAFVVLNTLGDSLSNNPMK